MNGIPYVLYGLVGVASAVAALVMVSYFGSARSDLGRDLLMPALTAAVLGGANIYGGSAVNPVADTPPAMPPARYPVSIPSRRKYWPRRAPPRSAPASAGRGLNPNVPSRNLGGANIYGGSGSILGTALAALLVGYLQQGLQMVGIPNQVSSALSGALLVVVVMGRSLSLHREWVRATWRRLFSHKTIGA